MADQTFVPPVPAVGPQGVKGDAGAIGAFGSDIVPSIDDTYDIGTPTFRVRHLIMAGDISMKTGGNFGIYDNVTQRLNIQPTSTAILGGGSALSVETAGITTMGAIFPSLPFGTDDLGSGASKYKDIHLAGTVYAGVGTINTSDMRKKTFHDLPAQLLSIVAQLEPRMYTLHSDPSNKLHFGFGAQDVQALFQLHGLEPSDYFLVLTPENGDGWYGLAYTEFHAIHLLYSQSLDARIAALEAKL